jgi:hypothetical protein
MIRRNKIMKRCILFFSLMILVARVHAETNLDSCDTEVTSRTYMAMSQPFQSQSPEMTAAFRSDRTHAREDGWHGALQGVVFGGRTTKSDNTARYYFPFGKTELLVEEDIKKISDLDPLNPVDLYTGHFGVSTTGETFKSRISIAPRQTMVGGGLHWRHSIWRKEERGVWVSVSLPIVHIKNEVNLKEDVLNDGGSIFSGGGFTAPAANMTAAFKQTAWNYGKIDDSADDMKRTGVADVEIKLGYEWLDTDPYHIESYIGIHVPTGNRPEGTYLMEAVVGAGKHVGLMFGNSFGCQLYADEANDRSLRMEFALGSKYLFKKEQIRSFDLNNKPWSRYIQMYASLDDATAAQTVSGTLGREQFTPGINILTQEVDVTPGFMHNLNAAWVFKAKWFQGELGYNLLSRQSECIEMESFKAGSPAIKALFGLGQTNPARDITGNFILEATEDTNFDEFPVPLSLYSKSVLTVRDIDLASGATPAHLAHTVYGSLGGNWDECRWPVLAHVGASYTFSRATNAVMDRWTIWAKLGVSV